MAARTPPVHVCAEPGCPELTDGTRCDEHQKAKRRASNAGRTSSAKLGYDERWKRTRRAFLRDHPLCPCGRRATDVDHIDGRGPLGPHGHDHANLQALCHSCHSSKTARYDGGFGRPRVER